MVRIGLTVDEYVDLKIKPRAGADRAFHEAAEIERQDMFPMNIAAAEHFEDCGILAPYAAMCQTLGCRYSVARSAARSTATWTPHATMLIRKCEYVTRPPETSRCAKP